MRRLDKETTIKLIELTEENKLNENIWKHIAFWSKKLDKGALDQVITLLITEVPNKDIIIKHLTSIEMDKYLKTKADEPQLYIKNLLNFLVNNEEIEKDEEKLNTILKYGNYNWIELEKTLLLSCVDDLFDETSLIPSRFDKSIITNKEFSIATLRNAINFYKDRIYSIENDDNFHTEWLIALLFNNEYKFNTYMSIIEHPDIKDNLKVKTVIENAISNLEEKDILSHILYNYKKAIDFLLDNNKIDLLVTLNNNIEEDCQKEKVVNYVTIATNLVKLNPTILEEENEYLLNSLFLNIMKDHDLTATLLRARYDLSKDKETIKKLLSYNQDKSQIIKYYLVKTNDKMFNNIEFLNQLDQLTPRETKTLIDQKIKEKLNKKPIPLPPQPEVISNETLDFISINNNIETLREFKKVLQGNTTEIEGLKNPYRKEME